MALSKKVNLFLSKYLFYLYLVLFPFGVLIKLRIGISDGEAISVNLIDILVFVIAVVTLFSNKKFPKFFYYIASLLFASMIGYVIFFEKLTPVQHFRGLMYLIRLTSYTLFFVYVFNLILQKKISRDKLIDYLISLSLAVSIFGLVQYFFIPDLRDLMYVGWDDHLYRLVSTYLDPTYTGIIITFGALLVLYLLKLRKLQYLPVFIVLIVALFLTYSRASYIAFIVGAATLFTSKKYFYLFLVVFMVILLLLPRREGFGVRLERTHSIFAKFGNYSQTYQLFKKSPLFGVGFNNICSFRTLGFNDDPNSHACSGSDSQILTILATTGIFGLLLFITLIIKMYSNISKSDYSNAFKACSLALLVHSSFSNSLFYPFVIGFYFCLLAINVKAGN